MTLELTQTERKLYDDAIARHPEAAAEIEAEMAQMVAQRVRVAQAQRFVPVNRFNLPRSSTKRAR